MELRYKLTDDRNQTNNGCTWTAGQWKRIPVHRRVPWKKLCSNAWYHMFATPVHAALFRGCAGVSDYSRLWEVEVRGDHCIEFLKEGWTFVRPVRIVDLPPPLTRAQSARMLLNLTDGLISRALNEGLWRAAACQRVADGWEPDRSRALECQRAYEFRAVLYDYGGDMELGWILRQIHERRGFDLVEEHRRVV